MSISPKELTAKLLGRKIVKVKGNSGEEFIFEIQRINIETFAGTDVSKLGNVVGKTQDEIKQMFMDKIKDKEISTIISPVLLDGIASPIVVDKEIYNEDKEIQLKVLLTDLELSSNLYMEILEISMKK